MLMKKYTSRFLILYICSFLCLAISSCSGGGGGSGSSGSSGRTTKTAVRIIHSSIDAVPLGVSSNGVYLGKTSFLGENQFYPISKGPGVLSISRSDRQSEVVQTLALDAKDGTEYTLFVNGAERDEAFNIKVLEEPVVQPAKGFGRVQVLNGLSDVSSITFSMGTNPATTVTKGQTSGFIDFPAGTYTLQINRTGGGILSSSTVVLSDRAELSIVISGRLSYDFVSTKVYEDLD